MPLNLIFISAIVVGLIGIGAIILRKIGVLTNLSEDEIMILKRRKNLWQKLKEVDYKQYWLSQLISLEKFLRKLKIWFLKTENFLNRLISFLRRRSQITAQKSKEWIKQREERRRKSFEKEESDSEKTETESSFSVKIEKIEPAESEPEEEVKPKKQAPNNFIASKMDYQAEPESQIEDDDLSISELKKPIKEEQKWIDLIVENPKNITAYKQLGLLYWRQHNYKDAKLSLEMAVKLGSKDRKLKEILEQIKK